MPETSGVKLEVTWTLTGRTREGESVHRVQIDCTPFRVGRRPDLSFCIPSPTVSNLHAEFLADGPRLRVRDLGSTNGTFVNGVRVKDESTVHHGDLIQFARVLLRVRQESGAAELETERDDLGNGSRIPFERLCNQAAMQPFFQPLVRTDNLATVGYEVLGSSRWLGFGEPASMFRAAAVPKSDSELNRLFRIEGVRLGNAIPGAPALFLNTHPAELEQPETLVASLRELRELRPKHPIVLQIHEFMVPEPYLMRELRAALGELSISLVYDDFAQGHDRLLELAKVPPDCLKFERKLVQRIHCASEQERNRVQDLVSMTHDLGVTPLAEGVESRAEHDICRQIGFDLGQGLYYGKPAPVKKYLQNSI